MSTQAKWVEPMEAVGILTEKYGDAAKRVIISRCERGLLEGVASVLVNTNYNVFEDVWNGAFERYLPEEVPDTRQTDVILPRNFWRTEMADAPPEGTGDNVSRAIQVYSDWTIGDFGWRHETSGSAGDGWQSFEAADVKFNRAQLSRLAGGTIDRRESDLPHAPPPRATMYDWEAAFAYVAARFYHDESYEDVHARGVPAKVTELLMDSFESRSLKVPSREACKKKAQKIVGELRAKIPK